MVKYPKVKVQLVGKDGNAFSILGACSKAARKSGLSEVEISGFRVEATSGDYNHLLQTCMEYFVVDG